MSQQVEGFVTAIDGKSGTSKQSGKPYTLYSVSLVSADGANLGTIGIGFDAPKFGVGNYIRFQVQKNARGYDEMVKGSGIVVSNPPPRQAPQAPAAAPAQSGGAIRSADGYWQTKFTHEVEVVEPRITFASAREKAVQVVDLMLRHDALVLTGAKGKQEDRHTAVLDAVDKLTAKFFFDSIDRDRVLALYPASGGATPAAPQGETTETEAPTADDLNDDIPF